MAEITSMQRVLTSLSHQLPDKVPLFLLFSHYGAKELGISIKDYFSNPDNIIEAQLKLHKKYQTDCLYGFQYASRELEAFGGSTIFYDDGPPNAGAPVLKLPNDIMKLKNLPPVLEINHLRGILTAIRGMKQEVADTVPIIGVVMSPFSLPIMQLGFDSYLNILMFEPALFERLMDINIGFCVDWANAQLDAGATAICYFDPVASHTIIPPYLYRETGKLVAQRTMPNIKGPIATHLASGRGLRVIDDIIETGPAVIGVSCLEDLRELKQLCKNRTSILGNLNGIEMCRWDAPMAEAKVKEAIEKAADGGGFILAENHGEVPWQVNEKTLEAITRAVDKWGRIT